MKNATVYGLHKCSTCQKAIMALQSVGYQVKMIDVRESPLSADQIEEWLSIFGEKLCNRASLTWRNLSEAQYDCPIMSLLQDHPSLMKRPLIIVQDQYFLGWTKSVKQALAVE